MIYFIIGILVGVTGTLVVLFLIRKQQTPPGQAVKVIIKAGTPVEKP